MRQITAGNLPEISRQDYCSSVGAESQCPDMLYEASDLVQSVISDSWDYGHISV